jgi:hypothetical protein
MHRRLAIPIALLLAALLSAGVAQGELTQRDGLRVAFDGGFTPHALPRDRPVPVNVHIEGTIGTANGSRPPQLRRIAFAINRHGKFFTRGLPTCSTGLLQSTTTQAALARCRPALVGRGSFGADVAFPTLSLIPVRGRLLAFNGRDGGRPAILLHLYVSNPVQVTFFLPFQATGGQGGGTFGTVLTASIPKIAGDLGYVTNIDLKIGRRYSYRGHPRSLFSASCAAPAGFSGAIFDFARGSFYFANGQQLTTTLTRNCRVR